MANPKKNPIIVKALQTPTDGKHIHQADVLRQYRIVWAEPWERLAGNWNVATGNSDRRVTTLLWNDQNILNAGLKYCQTHWYNYFLIYERMKLKREKNGEKKYQKAQRKGRRNIGSA